MPTIDELRKLFLFEAFSEEQLGWLMTHADEVSLAARERMTTEGEPADAFWVLLAGEVRLIRNVGGHETVLHTTNQPSTWTGWLPVFDAASPITSEVTRPSRLLRIPKDAVNHMLTTGFPVAVHLLAGLNWGVRNFEAIARQQEKLAALGKLSAGLAHELNNPAAAAWRAAESLHQSLRERDERALALGRRLDTGQAAALAEMLREIEARAATAPILDPLARGDREDAVAAWLDEMGTPDGYELAATLVDAGLELADLLQIQSRLPAAVAPDALLWLGAALASNDLARDVERSAARISELVRAIQDYSYMDQGPVQDVNVHDGLESTLKILAFRLRGITVVRDYDADLPRITVHGSELNQVWTNLINNAVDALRDTPTYDRRITIRTTPEDDGIVVEIADNGSGIPDEIQSRIFEPFFTTKDVGAGTGLGLDTSYRIVVGQHGGDIQVRSKPGDTRFRVWLPLVQVDSRLDAPDGTQARRQEEQSILPRREHLQPAP